MNQSGKKERRGSKKFHAPPLVLPAIGIAGFLIRLGVKVFDIF